MRYIVKCVYCDLDRDGEALHLTEECLSRLKEQRDNAVLQVEELKKNVGHHNDLLTAAVCERDVALRLNNEYREVLFSISITTTMDADRIKKYAESVLKEKATEKR